MTRAERIESITQKLQSVENPALLMFFHCEIVRTSNAKVLFPLVDAYSGHLAKCCSSNDVNEVIDLGKIANDARTISALIDDAKALFTFET